MSRDITLLHPEVQSIIPKFLQECKKKGLEVKITDTVRTEKEQNDLYAQGRTKPGNIVTNVKYPYSNHNWGMAFDICRNDGKGAYNDNDGWFKKVGQVGKSFGLEWGGDWSKFADKPHFELTKYGSTNDLVKKYKTPDNFKKTWTTISNEVVEKEYMKVKRILEYGDKREAFELINDDGKNYVSIQDISRLLNKNYIYENNTKITKFNDILSKTDVEINGKDEKIISINVQGSNFVKLRDIVDKLNYEINYNEKTKKIKLFPKGINVKKMYLNLKNTLGSK